MSNPSAFKTICLPNTDFMVDFLGFFTRDDFEKYLQLTCKRMNQLILTHFHSKPYRYLDNVTLMCILNARKLLCLSKPTTDRIFTICWNPSARQWTNSNCFVGLSKLRQFLDMTVRVPKVDIWIDRSVMTQQETANFKSLSHIWENAQVGFNTGRYSKESYLKDHLASSAELLSKAKFFCGRQLKCSYVDDMLPLWDYPEIYSLEAIEINFTSIERVEFDLMPIIKLIGNRALYPHSQTTFVFSEHKAYRERSTPLFTKTVLQHMANQLMESDKMQYFRIVFTVYKKFEGSDEDVDEFRLQNNRTREVLQLRCVTYNEVAKFCEFSAKTKYFILERSQI